MANEFDKIEQVIEFIARLDQQSAQKLSQELQKLNATRVSEVTASEDEIAKIQSSHAAARIQLAQRELMELEGLLTSKVEKELAQITRVMEANEARFKQVVEKAREAANAQQEIARTLSENELKQYESLLRNRDTLHKRQMDVEDARTRESGSLLSKFTGGMSTLQMASQASGFVTSKLPGDTEDEKQTKIAGDTLTGVLASKTPLEAAVNVLKGIYDSIDLSMKEDARRGAEMVQALGGTGGAGSREDLVAMKDALKYLEHNESVTTDKLKALAPAMGIMLKSTPNNTFLGDETPGAKGMSDKQQKEQGVAATLLELNTASGIVGKSLNEMADQVGDYSRKEGVTFRKGIQDTLIVFDQATVAGKAQNVSIGAITDNTFKLHDTMRPFGFSIQDSTKMVTKFAGELDKGILSLSDLVMWSTGMTRAGEGEKAFLFEKMRSAIANDPKYAALANTMDKVEKDPLARERAMTALEQGNIPALKALGIDVDAKSSAGMFKGALAKTVDVETDKFVPEGASQFTKDAYAGFIRRKFLDQLTGRSTADMTIEAQEALHGKEDAVLPTEAESAARSKEKMKEQDKINRDIREKSKGLINRLTGGLFERRQTGASGSTPEVLLTGSELALNGRRGFADIGLPGGGEFSMDTDMFFDAGIGASMDEQEFKAMKKSGKFAGMGIGTGKGDKMTSRQFGHIVDQIMQGEIGIRARGLGSNEADMESSVRRAGGLQNTALAPFADDPKFYNTSVGRQLSEFVTPEAASRMSPGMRQAIANRQERAGEGVPEALQVHIKVDSPNLDDPKFKEGLEKYVKGYMNETGQNPMQRAIESLTNMFGNQTGVPAGATHK